MLDPMLDIRSELYVEHDMHGVQMEEPYYVNVEYIDYQYFPVIPEDYEGTSDRPACEIPETAEHYPTQVGLLSL